MPKRIKKRSVPRGRKLLVDGISRMSTIGHGWFHLVVNVRVGMDPPVMVTGLRSRAVKELVTFAVDHLFGMGNMSSQLLIA